MSQSGTRRGSNSPSWIHSPPSSPDDNAHHVVPHRSFDLRSLGYQPSALASELVGVGPDRRGRTVTAPSRRTRARRPLCDGPDSRGDRDRTCRITVPNRASHLATPPRWRPVRELNPRYPGENRGSWPLEEQDSRDPGGNRTRMPSLRGR